MVQILAALLCWIAMLALISIAVLMSGVWRPRGAVSTATTAMRPPRRQVASQARAQYEAVMQAAARHRGQRQSRAG